MPVRTDEAHTRSCWQTDYWLRHCEGYRVFAGDEPIGYVDAVVFDDDDEPITLVARVGEVFTHCLEFPLGAVEGIDPGAERIFVAPLADLGADAFGRQLRIPAAV
jgi:hypothetical protein